jgi:quinol monooxygenase YgiN
MFVVTVRFIVKPEHIEAFETVMKRQAYNSLRHEDGCLQFDVCYDPLDARKFFLYEVYTGREAFEVHLKTDHFLSFASTVKDWVDTKTDHKWERFKAIT